MHFIYKRDGSKEEFKPYKIEDAIIKGFKSVGIVYDKIIFEQVLKEIGRNDLQTVE